MFKFFGYIATFILFSGGTQAAPEPTGAVASRLPSPPASSQILFSLDADPDGPDGEMLSAYQSGLLGRGKYGYVVSFKHEGCEFAAKFPNPDRRELPEFEYNLHRAVPQHAHLVSNRGPCSRYSKTVGQVVFGFVMDGMDGALDVSTERTRNWTDLERLGLLTGVARGLVHLHAHGVLHRDIKNANCFYVGTPPVGKLGDFSLAYSHTDSEPRFLSSLTAYPLDLKPPSDLTDGEVSYDFHTAKIADTHMLMLTVLSEFFPELSLSLYELTPSQDTFKRARSYRGRWEAQERCNRQRFLSTQYSPVLQSEDLRKGLVESLSFKMNSSKTMITKVAPKRGRGDEPRGISALYSISGGTSSSELLELLEGLLEKASIGAVPWLLPPPEAPAAEAPAAEAPAA